MKVGYIYPSGDDFGGKMVSLGTILLFACAVIGFTNIIVDPATIFEPVRNWMEKRAEKGNKIAAFFDHMWACYQCTGFWVGIICGLVLISLNPLTAIICGMAGSYLATWGATHLNYLVAKSVVLEAPEKENG